jgi:hypothetical protein
MISETRVAQFPHRPKVDGSEEEASSRMHDEGCPNENRTVDDATGYSKEEDEASEQAALLEEEAVSSQ